MRLVMQLFLVGILSGGMSGCASFQGLFDEVIECAGEGGEWHRPGDCRKPGLSEPPRHEPGKPVPSNPIPNEPGATDMCTELGHAEEAIFQKSLSEPSKRFVTNVDETNGIEFTRGKLTAIVSGIGELEADATDSFFLLIETVKLVDPYRMVFSGNMWTEKARGNMFTRFTAQHFWGGTRAGNQEKYSGFEHWLYSTSQYKYKCEWNHISAVCTVHEIGTNWTGMLVVPFFASLGSLDPNVPFVFGDKAAGNYQSVGPSLMVEKACLSIYE